MIINSAANRAYACAPVSRAWNNDNAFSEALETTENSAEDTLLASAPDKWVTEPGISFNAVNKALEYKKSLGIDDAEPTHELTAEQRDWLYSRHDLGSMQAYTSYSFVNDGGSTQYGVKATAEYSNFVADLAYLGVFSYDDLIQTSPAGIRCCPDTLLKCRVLITVCWTPRACPLSTSRTCSASTASALWIRPAPSAATPNSPS